MERVHGVHSSSALKCLQETISHGRPCRGLQEEEPQTAYSMAITGSHMADIVLTWDEKRYPDNQSATLENMKSDPLRQAH